MMGGHKKYSQNSMAEKISRQLTESEKESYKKLN